MHRPLLSLSLLLFSALPRHAVAQEDLDHSRNKSRLLLVFSPRASDPRSTRQNVLLTRSQAQFSERDLLRFEIFEQGQSRGAGALLSPHTAAGLRAHYHIRPGGFRVLLIGKDGHVAFSSPTPVALSGLTSRIDRMPMRRDEMRRRRANLSGL